jgi:hypothetical protein
MRMKITITLNELIDVLSRWLDQDVIQYHIRDENVTQITAECEPTGELLSLDVYVDFDQQE